jgi:transcriptional regulator with XRE-family HTH domain
MNSLEERMAFSERLRQALNNANYSPRSPTQLAREFNNRFEGHSVTVHAARKWLHGESIPTQEKLRALASWLDVPAEWLRFGNELNKGKGQAAHLSSMEARLLTNLQQLDEHHRQLAHELLRLIIRMNKKK